MDQFTSSISESLVDVHVTSDKSEESPLFDGKPFRPFQVKTFPASSKGEGMSKLQHCTPIWPEPVNAKLLNRINLVSPSFWRRPFARAFQSNLRWRTTWWLRCFEFIILAWFMQFGYSRAIPICAMSSQPSHLRALKLHGENSVLSADSLL